MFDNTYKRSVKIWETYGDEKQAIFCCMKRDKWNKARKFIVVRELKPGGKRKQQSLFKSDYYNHDFYVTNTT